MDISGCLSKGAGTSEWLNPLYPNPPIPRMNKFDVDVQSFYPVSLFDLTVSIDINVALPLSATSEIFDYDTTSQLGGNGLCNFKDSSPCKSFIGLNSGIPGHKASFYIVLAKLPPIVTPNVGNTLKFLLFSQVKLRSARFIGSLDAPTEAA